MTDPIHELLGVVIDSRRKLSQAINDLDTEAKVLSKELLLDLGDNIKAIPELFPYDYPGRRMLKRIGHHAGNIYCRSILAADKFDEGTRKEMMVDVDKSLFVIEQNLKRFREGR